MYGATDKGTKGAVLAGNTVPTLLVAHSLELRQTTQNAVNSTQSNYQSVNSL